MNLLASDVNLCGPMQDSTAASTVEPSHNPSDTPIPRQQNLAMVDAMHRSVFRGWTKFKGWFGSQPSSPPHAIQTSRGSPPLAQSQDAEWEDVVPSGIGERSGVNGEHQL